MDHLFE